MTTLEVKNLIATWVQYLLDKINNLVTSTLPAGGTTNQVLTKDSNADFDVSWQDPGASAGVSSLTATTPLNADVSTGDVTIDIDAASGSGAGSMSSSDFTKLSGIETGADVTDAGNVGSVINASTNKATPGDGDKFAMYDVTGAAIKHSLWSDIKTALASVFVPVTRTVNSKALSSNITLTQDDVGDGTTYKQYSTTEKSKLSGIEASADVTDIGNVSSVLNGASAETPVDADKFPFVDATDNTAKTVTGTNLKSYLGTSELGIQIHAKTAETPTDSDEFVFSDATDSNAGKKVTGANLKTYIGASSTGDQIHAATAATIATGDEMGFVDVDDSNNLKKRTWGELLTSPTLTGTPAAPTAAADTNTTQIATTAYYCGQIGTATPLANGTAAAGTSKKFSPIDHIHPLAIMPGIITSQTITDNTSIDRPYVTKLYIIDNSSTAKTLTLNSTPTTADNGVVIMVTRAQTSKAHAVQLTPDQLINLQTATSGLFTFSSLGGNGILYLMPYEGQWYGFVSSSVGNIVMGAWS